MLNATAAEEDAYASLVCTPTFVNQTDAWLALYGTELVAETDEADPAEGEAAVGANATVTVMAPLPPPPPLAPPPPPPPLAPWPPAPPNVTDWPPLLNRSAGITYEDGFAVAYYNCSAAVVPAADEFLLFGLPVHVVGAVAPPRLAMQPTMQPRRASALSPLAPPASQRRSRMPRMATEPADT